jgi:urease accessory protein
VFRRRDGVTCLADQWGQAPWRIVRPFQLPDGSALLQLSQVGPGIMAGDCYHLDVAVEPGASVVMLGAAATKLLTMSPGVLAEHSVACTVADGAALEYYPGMNIPFAGADVIQRVTANLAPTARFGMMDMWAAGRVQHGESAAFRRISSRTAVDLSGAPLYRDALELEPGARHAGAFGILEGHEYLLNGLWYPGSAAHEAVEKDGLLAATGSIAGGTYARALATSGIALLTFARASILKQRALWGLPALPLDRYSTAFA